MSTILSDTVTERPSSQTLSMDAEHAQMEPIARRKSYQQNAVLAFIPNAFRNHFVAFLGEYVGTFLFLFFAFSGTQVANNAASNASTNGTLNSAPDTGVVLYIAFSFGISLLVNAWVFFRISGGLFNPAVTLALYLIGAFNWIRALTIFIAQILGAITAAGIVSGLLPGPMAVTTTLGQATSLPRALFIETFATFQLVFCIIMLAAEKNKSTYLAPIGIGFSLFISELAAVPFTGGSLNPARSFAPAVVLRSFESSHWIYWLGPVLGATLAVGLYRAVKILEYETANPGQDFDDQEHEIFQARAASFPIDDLEKGGAAAEALSSREQVRRPVVAVAVDGQGLVDGSVLPSVEGGRARGWSDASAGQQAWRARGLSLSPAASRSQLRSGGKTDVLREGGA